MEKEKEITGLLIDVENNRVEITTIPNDLENLYRVLNCSTIDIVSRRVGKSDKWYTIVCDDEGLLKDSPLVSAVNYGFVELVGNLFVCDTDPEGNLKSLPKKRLTFLLNHVGYAYTAKRPNEPHRVLWDVHYY